MAKATEAFRNIGEVSKELAVKKHVLRFWEQKFPQVKPMKRGGGRRLYRPADVELLRGIRDLLQNAGYTIKGVQKILREQGVEQVKLAGELVAARANQASADGAAASQTAFAQSTGRAHPAQNRWRTRRLRRTAKNRGRAQGERAAREARGIAQLAFPTPWGLGSQGQSPRPHARLPVPIASRRTYPWRRCTSGGWPSA